MPRNSASMGSIRARILIGSLLKVSLIWPSFAGPAPLATDVFPTFHRIVIAEGRATFVDQWENEFTIDVSDWKILKEFSLPPNNMRMLRFPPPPRSKEETCEAPDFLLQELSNEAGQATLLFCTDGYAWIASRAYCSEGLDAQSVLYSYDLRSGSVRDRPGVIPPCEEIGAIDEIDSRMVFAFRRPWEYGPGPGSGLLAWEPATDQRTWLPALPDSDVMVGVSYDRQNHSLWVAAYEGLHRLDMETGRWESRYFEVELSQDEDLRLALAESKPPESRLWMAHYIAYFPIERKRDFAHVWDTLEIRPYDFPSAWHPDLLPFYVEAIRRLAGSSEDYHFRQLLDLVASNAKRHQLVTDLVKDLNDMDLGLEKREALTSHFTNLAPPGGHAMLDAEFERLFAMTFEKPSYSAGRQLCRLSFRSPTMMRRLNSRLLAADWQRVHIEFVGYCIRYRAGSRNAEIFLPAFKKALSLDDSRSLRVACSVFHRSAQPSFRRRDIVFPILEARRLAEQYTGSDGPAQHCKTASYWIANWQAGIDEILAGIDQSPELHPIARDVLGKVTGQSFDDFERWRAWWKAARDSFVPADKAISDQSGG